MKEWIDDMDLAIDDLTSRKKLLQKSCYTCWDPSIDWALDALKIIRELLRIHEQYHMINKLELLIIRMHYEKKENDND